MTSKTSKLIKTIGLIIPWSKFAESGEKKSNHDVLDFKRISEESVPPFFVFTLAPTTVAPHYYLCQES